MKDVNPLFNLTGKVALVTGGSRGIGKAISLALAIYSALEYGGYFNGRKSGRR